MSDEMLLEHEGKSYFVNFFSPQTQLFVLLAFSIFWERDFGSPWYIPRFKNAFFVPRVKASFTRVSKANEVMNTPDNGC